MFDQRIHTIAATLITTLFTAYIVAVLIFDFHLSFGIGSCYDGAGGAVLCAK